MKGDKTMKKSATKSRLFVVICIMISSLLFANIYVVSAHEMYYDGSTGIVLKWHDVTNRTAYLKMNDDLLDSSYSSYYYAVRTAWPNASARVSVTDTVLSYSNVDLATATETYWRGRYGYLESMGVLGVCDISSTDNIEINNLADAKACSGLIKYAGILYTPFESVFENSTHMKFVMMHEIGHSLGLGHPNDGYYVTSAASVMRTQSIETYYTPQAHDISDLNSKY